MQAPKRKVIALFINYRFAHDGSTGAGAPDEPSPGEKVARPSAARKSGSEVECGR